MIPYTWLWIFILSTKQGLPIAGPSQQKQLTLHKDRDTTWNHANKFCKYRNKKLVTMDSLDVVNAIKKFDSDNAIWNGGLKNFWIGLHDINDRPDVADYVWSTCEPLGDFKPWDNNDDINAKHCVRANKEMDFPNIWETMDCSSKGGVIMCEEAIGPCEFKPHGYKLSDTNGSGSPSTLSLGTISLSECKRMCLSYYKDGEECWGYGTGFVNCVLYIGTSLAQVTDSMTSRSFLPSYVKSCYVGTTGSDISKAKYEGDVDIFPWSGCSYPIGLPGSISSITTTPSSTLSLQSFHTTSSPRITTIAFLTTVTLTKTREPTSIPSSERTFITKLLTAIRNTTSNTMLVQTTFNDFANRISDNVPLDSSTTDKRGPGDEVSSETSSTQSTEEISTDRTSQQWIPRYVSASTSWKTTGPINGTLSFAANHSKMTTPMVIETGELSPTMDVSRTTGTINQSAECVCYCANLHKLTEKEKELLLETILRDLTIDLHHISATRRKYISVDDPRPSAKIIGSAGIVILSLTLVGVFVLDFGAIMRDVKILYHTLKDIRH